MEKYKLIVITYYGGEEVKGVFDSKEAAEQKADDMGLNLPLDLYTTYEIKMEN